MTVLAMYTVITEQEGRMYYAIMWLAGMANGLFGVFTEL